MEKVIRLNILEKNCVDMHKGAAQHPDHNKSPCSTHDIPPSCTQVVENKMPYIAYNWTILQILLGAL